MHVSSYYLGPAAAPRAAHWLRHLRLRRTFARELSMATAQDFSAVPAAIPSGAKRLRTPAAAPVGVVAEINTSAKVMLLRLDDAILALTFRRGAAIDAALHYLAVAADVELSEIRRQRFGWRVTLLDQRSPLRGRPAARPPLPSRVARPMRGPGRKRDDGT